MTAADFELISKLGIKTIQGSSKFVYYLFKGCSMSAHFEKNLPFQVSLLKEDNSQC